MAFAGSRCVACCQGCSLCLNGTECSGAVGGARTTPRLAQGLAPPVPQLRPLALKVTANLLLAAAGWKGEFISTNYYSLIKGICEFTF